MLIINFANMFNRPRPGAAGGNATRAGYKIIAGGGPGITPGTGIGTSLSPGAAGHRPLAHSSTGLKSGLIFI